MQLIEALQRDLTSQMLKVLQNFNIMLIDYNVFKNEISKNITEVHRVWDDNIKTFREHVRSQFQRLKEK